MQELGIHSDSSSAHRAVAALPDLAKITEKQQIVAKATTDIVSAARTFSSNRQKAAAEDKAKAEAEFEGRLKAQNDGSYEAFSRLSDSERQAVLISESEAYRKADTEAQNWGIGGSKSRALNAGTILLTGILGGKTNLQTAANTLSPYAAAAIGNTFGHGDNKNETAQLVGHFVLGATLAYINGGDPLSGGSAAVAAEKAAQYLSQQYNDGKTAIDPQTGEFNPNLLPEHIKEEIKSTTGVIASIVGATGDGGSALNAQIGGVLGQNAVENNDSGCTSATPLANCGAIQKSILDNFEKSHYCKGLSVEACGRKLSTVRANYGRENGKLIYEYLGDWIPVVSTIKGAKEAQNAADYIFAAADIFPPAGKGLRISRAVFNKMVERASRNNNWGEVRAALSDVLQQVQGSLGHSNQLAMASNGQLVKNTTSTNRPNVSNSTTPSSSRTQLVRGKKGDWNKLANKPEANTVYEFENGYTYATDSQKRVKEVTADLKLDAWDRNSYQQSVSGRECRQGSDCGGHLIASMFGGPGEGVNLVPMDAKLNGASGEWYKLEQQWKNVLSSGGKVQVKIEPVYSGSSKRPSSFTIRFSENNRSEVIRVLKNTPTGK